MWQLLWIKESSKIVDQMEHCTRFFFGAFSTTMILENISSAPVRPLAPVHMPATTSRRRCSHRPAAFLPASNGIATTGRRRRYHQPSASLPSTIGAAPTGMRHCSLWATVLVPPATDAATIGHRRCPLRAAALLHRPPAPLPSGGGVAPIGPNRLPLLLPAGGGAAPTGYRCCCDQRLKALQTLTTVAPNGLRRW
jgi:hypothetical protein